MPTLEEAQARLESAMSKKKIPAPAVDKKKSATSKKRPAEDEESSPSSKKAREPTKPWTSQEMAVFWEDVNVVSGMSDIDEEASSDRAIADTLESFLSLQTELQAQLEVR